MGDRRDPFCGALADDAAGLSPFHARQVVAVARRHGELPMVMTEFAAGQLSLDQVAVVARYAPAHTSRHHKRRRQPGRRC